MNLRKCLGLINPFKIIILICILFAQFVISDANAVVKLDITRGNFKPISISIMKLTAQNNVAPKLIYDISRVLGNDLDNSGLFKSYIYDIDIAQDINNIELTKLSSLRGEQIISGVISILPDNKVQITFQLTDMVLKQQILEKTYVTPLNNWRRIAHMIADAVYQRLTGEDGYFDSRIVYIAETGDLRNRVKRMAIMDQDGANHMYLTRGDYMALTPRFSPSSQRVVYMSYLNNDPKVYMRDIYTNNIYDMGNIEGMSFAPRFSFSGDRVVMSIAHNGNSDIYSLNLNNMRRKRLTKRSSIDTSPTYSSDDKKIAFTSDRGGTPQIYIMNADGSNIERITFGGGRYQTPVWSPRGDLIAFTKQSQGKFYIGVIRPDGSGERLLTENYLVDEGPTWSPNGRIILFTRQVQVNGTNVNRIYSIDLTGNNLHELSTPTDASDPAWSPLLTIR